MQGRFLLPMSILCIAAGTSWAASDPFVGKWVVNASESQLFDEMTIEDLGENRYTFTFVPGAVETVVADGTDQPALSGTTLSITKKSPNTWEVVRKSRGRVSIRARWKLSDSGKSLSDSFTQYLPDGMTLFSTPLPNGSALVLPYVYERTAGHSGFVGTWDSDSAKVKAGMELEVQSYEGESLSFRRSDEDKTGKFQLDGEDHADVDAAGRDLGTTYSGRRTDARTLEITFKARGEVTGTRQVVLSPDLKVLTITERLLGQRKPKSILVFQHE